MFGFNPKNICDKYSSQNCAFHWNIYILGILADPWHFGVDPDPDPRSQPLTNGSGFRSGFGSGLGSGFGSGPGSRFGSGSFYFRHWPSRRQQKLIFMKRFFCLLHFEGTFTSFFKYKKSKSEFTKQEESRFFFLFLLDDWRIRIRIHTSH